MGDCHLSAYQLQHTYHCQAPPLDLRTTTHLHLGLLTVEDYWTKIVIPIDKANIYQYLVKANIYQYLVSRPVFSSELVQVGRWLLLFILFKHILANIKLFVGTKCENNYSKCFLI